jgi:thiamine pyrophosphate-dependent acetolactate synthase large subunit-like protein
MGLPDLDTVVRTARSALVVVVDDSAYGAEVHQYGSQGLDQSLMRFPEVDFAGIARGFGAQAATIATLADLEAVRQWLDDGARGTFVADVRVSPDVVAPFMHEMAANAVRRR